MRNGTIKNYYLPDDVPALIVEMSEQLQITKSALVGKMTYHYCKCQLDEDRCQLKEERAKPREGDVLLKLLKKVQEGNAN